MDLFRLGYLGAKGSEERRYLHSVLELTLIKGLNFANGIHLSLLLFCELGTSV